MAEGLRGRVVLLTRPAGRTGSLAARLQALGARAEERPTIAFAPPRDPAAVEEALARADGFAWIAVTSPQGAEAFAAAWRGLARGARPRARLAAVGEGTARALRELGLAPALVAAGDAASLGAAMGGATRPGERVLLVRPETASGLLPEALAAADLAVEAIAFYRTVAAPDVRETARRTAEGAFDAAVFSSPSTFQRLREAGEGIAGFPAALQALARVAIGEMTAAALAKAGYPAGAVAGDPSDEGLVRALLRCYHPGPSAGHEGR